MATVTPIVNLDFNYDTKQVSVSDTTVWPTLNGTSLKTILTLKGLGSLTAPSVGTIFNITNPATPLINLSAGATTSTNYNLPLASGNIAVGTYTLAYNAHGSYTQSAIAIEAISNLGYIEVDDDNLAAFLLEAGDTITIASSPQSGNNGTHTVVSVQALNTFSRIYISGTLINDSSGSGRLTYSISRTYATTLTPAYSGCTKITPSIAFSSQPYTGENGTLIVSDTTDYTGVTVSGKTLSVAYPDGVYPAPTVNPVVGSDVTSVTITAVATGTYTITLDGQVVLAQSDGLNLSYSISGIRVNSRPVNVFERVVVWNGNLCCLQPCIQTVFDKHNRFVMQGQESPYTAAVADLSLAVNKYLIALQCGDQERIDTSYQDIKAILENTDCPCDCGCNDSNPVWISNANQEGQSVITDLQDQINAIDAQITTINGQITTLQDDVTALQADITALQNATPLVYVAEFSQATGASTVSVVRTISNTLGLTPAFTYISAGQVRLTGSTGLLPQAKTSVSFQTSLCANSPTHVDIAIENTNNSFIIYGSNGSGYGNGNINGIITITVYP